jgi:signal transduction histidine kinase
MEASDPSTTRDGFTSAADSPTAGDGKAVLGSGHVRALSRVSAALCGLSDLQAVLRVGLDSVFDLLEGTVAGILLLDEDSQTLRYHIAYGLPRGTIDETVIRVGEGMAGQVVQSGKAILLEDASLVPDAARDGLASTEVPPEQMKALASIPLRSRNRLFGAINVASRLPRRFGRDDMFVLYSIGEQMGVAIERAEVYDQLRKGRETYQQLARYCLVAEDEERRRIVRDLHDETSQAISALALNMRALVEMAEMSGQSPPFVEQIRKVEAMAQRTAQELTRIMNDLRPTLLDSAGLVPAIRRLAEENLHLHGIETAVEINGTCPRLASEVEANIFRLAQSAIMNIVLHAEATKTWIVVDCGDERLDLRIRDNGRGFDASKITGIDEQTGRGRGLVTMEERATLLGGAIRFESAPGKGTTIVAEIPLKGLADAQDSSSCSRRP